VRKHTFPRKFCFQELSQVVVVNLVTLYVVDAPINTATRGIHHTGYQNNIEVDVPITLNAVNLWQDKMLK
jgi:hypothetical protein